MRMKIAKILFWVLLLGLQVLWGWYFTRRVWPGDPAQITNDMGKPMAVLTIDYGERPRNFVEGEFYVLKCLKVRGTKIDYGFCPIERQGFYNTRKEKEQ